MRGRTLIGAALAAAASIGGLAVVGGGAVSLGDASPGISQTSQRAINKNAQNPIKQAGTDMRAMLGGGIGSAYGRRRRAAYGWTDRHQRRVALKKRNQVRHRAAGRGGKR